MLVAQKDEVDSQPFPAVLSLQLVFRSILYSWKESLLSMAFYCIFTFHCKLQQCNIWWVICTSSYMQSMEGTNNILITLAFLCQTALLDNIFLGKKLKKNFLFLFCHGFSSTAMTVKKHKDLFSGYQTRETLNFHHVSSTVINLL